MLIFSGIFSGIEIAFVSANKLKIELKSAQGDRRAGIISGYFKKTSRMITTILVGNNLALVIYGISIAHILNIVLFNQFGIDPRTEPTTSLVLQTLISTLIILIFGEYLPKAFFRRFADDLLIRFAWVLKGFYIAFKPLAGLISGLSNFLLKRAMGLEYSEEEVVFSKKDLDHYINETLADTEGSTLEEIDAEMFSNAMEFNETRVREFMIPRTEIDSMPVETSVEELLDFFIETEHSKIMVYGESIDQMLGYVHSTSMYKFPKSIREIMQPILIVPESMPANVLLSEFNKNRRTVAVVVDEHGGTEGMVTIEDLIEEVFGEIDDEHDEPEDEELEKVIDDRTFLFSARWEVDDVNKNHNLELPEGDYTTLSGLVMHIAESIPAVNETVELANYRITVVDAAENKINVVKVEKLD